MAKINSDTAIELNACFMNPQNVLAEALQKRDLASFEEALRRGAAPDIEDPKVHMSIFEKLCKTKDSGDFMKLCIKYGDVDVNKVNGHFKKSPINLVAEAKSFSNLQGILTASAGVEVNRAANGMTPLLKLVQSLNDDTVEELFKCIKLLLDYGADPNIANQQNVTPIIALLNRVDKLTTPEPIVRLFLSHPRLDLDSHRNGEARELLSELFPHLNVPTGSTDEPVTYEKLRQLLKNEMEELFLDQIRAANAKDVVDAERTQEQDNLMIAATENGLCNALDALVQLGADVNAGGRKCPLKLACQRGEWKVLNQLLKCDSINLSFNKNDPPLCIVVKKLGEKNITNRCDYYECFKILIKDSRVDVNEVDLTGSTALHYAVKYKNENAIKALLQRSAYIGVEDRFKDIPIVEITADTLKKRFDDCISVNNLRPGDNNYQIQFDYSNFCPNKSSQSSEEMLPITYIAKNPELRHLMKHPLISSFLFLKWQRLSVLFYINLILYFLFCFSLIGYSVFCYGHDVSKEWAALLWSVSVVGGCYVLLRELFQFFTAPQVYFTSVENWIEILMLALSGLVLSDVGITDENRRFVASTLILLLALEFAVLVGALPILSFSTHMVMLKTVFTSLLRSLAFYSIILVSFALCFYTLLGGGSAAAESNATAAGNSTEEESDDFNKFVSPWMSILKTIVMMTGEFDAGSIDLRGPSSYGIFLLFVIFISIVLFNLLNGLAVSDTQQIKAEAELVGLIGRAELLARFERIVSRRNSGNPCSGFILQNPFFNRICKGRISLFPDFLPSSQIRLLPNDRNKILIPSRKDMVVELFKNARSHSEESLVIASDLERADHSPTTLGCCLFMERCTRLDGGIAKQAHAVLARKQSETEAENEKRSYNRRIARLEEKLDLIINGLTEMQKMAK